MRWEIGRAALDERMKWNSDAMRERVRERVGGLEETCKKLNEIFARLRK